MNSADGTSGSGPVRHDALRLRPLRLDDQATFAAAHHSMAAAGHLFGIGLEPGVPRGRYATEILRQSLVIARASGVSRVLVTCDEDNIGSIAVIEACGGRLESVIETAPSAPRKRRYWID